jgi:hypothetical protein
MHFPTFIPIVTAILSLSSVTFAFPTSSPRFGKSTFLHSRDVSSDATSLVSNAGQLTDYIGRLLHEENADNIQSLAHVSLTTSLTMQVASQRIFEGLKVPSQLAASAMNEVQKMTQVTDALGAVVANAGDVEKVGEEAKTALCLL